MEWRVASIKREGFSLFSFRMTKIDKFFNQTKPNMAKRKRSTKKSKTKTKRTKVNNSKKSFKKNWKKAKRIRKRLGSKAINVKEDKEGYSKSYIKQKVTKQQQKIINKRFKNGHSPFTDSYVNQFQDTVYNEMDKCKWVWRTQSTLTNILKAFQYFPSQGNQPGGSATIGDVYQNSSDQSIYFNQFKYRYEILNPTDYDMNLVIYDIVCKQDTEYEARTWSYNSTENGFSSAQTVPNTAINYVIARDPIRCIYQGLNKQDVLLNGASSTSTFVADPNAKNIFDINLKPTESYPFNIYYKIVKKHTFKLQPGASLTHTFIHKPKALINRGYLGYRFAKELNATNANSTRDIAVKDITSGCLFKYWGQVSGKGDSSLTKSSSTITGQAHDEVWQLSGRLMFKEYIDLHWCAMDQKFNFRFNNNSSKSTSGVSEESLEVVNKSHIQTVNAMDIEKNNTTNSGAATSTTNP